MPVHEAMQKSYRLRLVAGLFRHPCQAHLRGRLRNCRSSLYRCRGRGNQTERHLHLNIGQEQLRWYFIGKTKNQHGDPVYGLKENLDERRYGLLSSVVPAPQKRVADINTGETEIQWFTPSGGQKKGAPDALSTGFIHEPQKTHGSGGLTLPKVLEWNWQFGIPQGKLRRDHLVSSASSSASRVSSGSS